MHHFTIDKKCHYDIIIADICILFIILSIRKYVNGLKIYGKSAGKHRP